MRCDVKHPVGVGIYCPGQAGVRGNERSHCLVSKAPIIEMPRIGRSVVVPEFDDAVWKVRPRHDAR